MFSLTSILKMMKPFLGDVEKKLANAMKEQDAEYGTTNIAYLIRRVKVVNKKTGQLEDTCQMSYIDIREYTGIAEDPKQEYALKALFVKDKNKISTDFPLGKNKCDGIDGIFNNATKENEED